MPGRYYSFEKSEWHFIVLDSAQENNGGYIARIDEEQYAWLETELNSIPANKHICMHRIAYTDSFILQCHVF
jgi:Icc protein